MTFLILYIQTQITQTKCLKNLKKMNLIVNKISIKTILSMTQKTDQPIKTHPQSKPMKKIIIFQNNHHLILKKYQNMIHIPPQFLTKESPEQKKKVCQKYQTKKYQKINLKNNVQLLHNL